jgi:hypothetical protein
MADAYIKPTGPREPIPPGSPASAPPGPTPTSADEAGQGPDFLVAVIWAAAFVGMFVPIIVELVVNLFRG